MKTRDVYKILTIIFCLFTLGVSAFSQEEGVTKKSLFMLGLLILVSIHSATSVIIGKIEDNSKTLNEKKEVKPME